MASKRNLKRKVCGSKVGYDNPLHARQAIGNLQRNRGFQGELHYYECPFCKKLHVGHKPGGQHYNWR